MDLSTITTVLLLQWHATALAAFASVMAGGRPASVSYSSGNGSKSVSFTPSSGADLRAWIAQLARELARRGAIVPQIRRRAIGVGF